MLFGKGVFDQDRFVQLRKFDRRLLKKSYLQRKQYRELLDVLNQKNLKTYYQPIVEIKGETLVGYEALNRPITSKCFRTTEEFYQFLGETDQIFQFEQLTRKFSIERYVEMKALSTDNELIFLNVHPFVLSDANYRSGQTLHLVEKYGLDPRRVVFEITEKQSVQDYRQFERVLDNYRSQGFKIAIDDVGAGYNSLKTMIYVKPDFIKLDRSFIQNIDTQIAQQKLVQLFVQYASLSATAVIAEGVERKEELQFLKKIEVDYAQGYFIGKPSTQLLLKKEPRKLQLKIN